MPNQKMRQRVILLLSLLALIILLIGLNAASYVQQEQIPDSEARPNRSTFNSGSTGTKALHDLLLESGHLVSRWQDSFTKDFETFDPEKLGTLVVIGSVRRPFEEEEVQNVLGWVSKGGQLVVIDREPNEEFLVTSAPWEISIADGRNALSASEKEYLIFSVDPANEAQMTAKTEAVRPAQPSVFNSQVNAVQPSKFSTSLKIARVAKQDPKPKVPKEVDPSEGDDGDVGAGDAKTADIGGMAPLVHLSSADKQILVDSPLGAGRIVVLTDPYIVANGGIGLVDNAQLAVNVITSKAGPIAFDEYHQGFGNDDNRLVGYFSGTPVVAIFLQASAFIALLLISRGRRFARPLPAEEPDRLSKLEYVAAMAQLQNRTKAYDLALENVYTDFRRRVSRFLGVDNYTITKETLATLISCRIGNKPAEILDLLETSEDIMHGVPTRKKVVLRTVKRLREIEDSLGLKRGAKKSAL